MGSPGRSGLSPGDWLRQQGSEAHALAVSSLAAPEPTSLEQVFAEEPVDLDVFVRDRKFIGMQSLSNPQYDVLRAAERVYYPELYPLMAEEWGPYWSSIPVVNFLTLLVGKGGGKDLIARLVSLRIAYLLLCLRDPRTYFGMPDAESIHLLNVASTKTQARLAYFEPMTRIVARGWFADRCQPLKTAIEWDKGLTSISGSSDAETQEGLNLILGVADEVDAFHTAEDLRRAGARGNEPVRSIEGIVRMLRTSGMTRFPRTFKNLRISYPRYFRSPIMEMHGEAHRDIAEKGEQSRHFVVGPMPSWDFNPILARGEFVSIPQSPVPVPEEFVTDFTKDPAWAHTAYLCRPARTRLPAYFRSISSVEECVSDGPAIEVNWSFDGRSWHPSVRLSPALVPLPGATYVCHADLALKRDRAGFALAHVVSWADFESMDVEGDMVRWERLPYVQVDAALALEADLAADPPREIQLRTIRRLVFELRNRGFRIAQCSLDGWQSLSIRQDMEVVGILAPIVSVDRTEDQYRVLRDGIEEGRFKISVCPEWRELVVGEFLGLVWDPRLRKVDHAPEGVNSKDITDAIAGAVWGAVDIGGQETEDDILPGSAEGMFGVATGPDLPFGLSDIVRPMLS